MNFQKETAIKLAKLSEEQMSETDARQYCFDRLVDEFMELPEDELMRLYVNALRKEYE